MYMYMYMYIIYVYVKQANLFLCHRAFSRIGKYVA